MKNNIEKLRKKLHIAINKYGIKSEQAIKISNEFNEIVNLINIYRKKEIKYQKSSIIYTKYLESTEMLQRITKEFGKFPTKNEWNKYAKEKKLLCSESIKYITGINWRELKNKQNLES